MLKCWSFEPPKRPSFREIKETLWYIFTNDKQYHRWRSLSAFVCFRDILTDERRERDETMWRENRRVQAMSWGSSGSDEPPPKPSRVPANPLAAGTINRTGGCSSTLSSTSCSSSAAPGAAEGTTAGATTYLVAPNSEVLAQLMRENENRSADAAMYSGSIFI